MEYKSLVDKLTPKENRVKNMIVAFFSGGVIGAISEIINSEYMIIFWIVIASILTGMGLMDKIVDKLKMGVIIPITGFAHSLTSASLEYKKEGLITGIGTNYMRLAGSVILYGIVSSFVLAFIRGIL